MKLSTLLVSTAIVATYSVAQAETEQCPMMPAHAENAILCPGQGLHQSGVEFGDYRWVRGPSLKAVAGALMNFCGLGRNKKGEDIKGEFKSSGVTCTYNIPMGTGKTGIVKPLSFILVGKKSCPKLSSDMYGEIAASVKDFKADKLDTINVEGDFKEAKVSPASIVFLKTNPHQPGNEFELTAEKKKKTLVCEYDTTVRVKLYGTMTTGAEEAADAAAAKEKAAMDKAELDAIKKKEREKGAAAARERIAAKQAAEAKAAAAAKKKK